MNEPHWVVRGGIAQAADLQNGYREHLAVPGLSGFSVQAHPVLSIDELAAAGQFSNRQISYVAHDDLVAAAQSCGYNVSIIPSPGWGYHHTVTASTMAGSALADLPDDLATALSACFMRMPNPTPRP